MAKVLQFAIERLTHKLIHISEVKANGNACNCNCPACGEPLTAKRDATEVIQHFAHQAGRTCEHASESALHLLAKEIIMEQNAIMLPAYNGGFVVRKSTMVNFVNVKSEISCLGLRPDIIGYAQNNDGSIAPLWIEILVTHEVDNAKKQKIKQLGAACIEINMEKFTQKETFSKEEVTDFLLRDSSQRYWINNPKLDTLNKEEKKRLEAISKDAGETIVLQNLSGLISRQVTATLAQHTTIKETRETLDEFPYSNKLMAVYKEQIAERIHDEIFDFDNGHRSYASGVVSIIRREPFPFVLEAIYEKGQMLQYLIRHEIKKDRVKLQQEVMHQLYVNEFGLSKTEETTFSIMFRDILQKRNLSLEEQQLIEKLVQISLYQAIFKFRGDTFLRKRMLAQLQNYKTLQYLFIMASIYYDRIIGVKAENYQELTDIVFEKYLSYAYLFVELADQSRNNEVIRCIRKKIGKRQNIKDCLPSQPMKTPLVASIASICFKPSI